MEQFDYKNWYAISCYSCHHLLLFHFLRHIFYYLFSRILTNGKVSHKFLQKGTGSHYIKAFKFLFLYTSLNFCICKQSMINISFNIKNVVSCMEENYLHHNVKLPNNHQIQTNIILFMVAVWSFFEKWLTIDTLIMWKEKKERGNYDMFNSNSRHMHWYHDDRMLKMEEIKKQDLHDPRNPSTSIAIQYR